MRVALMRVGVVKEIWNPVYSVSAEIFGIEDHVIEIDQKFYMDIKETMHRFTRHQNRIEDLIRLKEKGK